MWCWNLSIRRMCRWISPRIVSSYMIAWFSIIRWPTLCAKSPKCISLSHLNVEGKRYKNLRHRDWPQSSSQFVNINKNTVMSVSTFVDLQGFIVDEIFVVKKFAVLREGYVLSYYIFGSSVPWNHLTKSERSCASWLNANHHRLQ